MLVYSYDITGGSSSLEYTGIFSVTDVDQRRAGNYSFIQKTDFHKVLWFLLWNITSRRSKQPVTSNVQDDGSYSVLKKTINQKLTSSYHKIFL